ncbi:MULTISPECIES: hypothetical protein [unclassified Prochlorococcus]|uniref:hypothetical protein n=1 Tax=unclassified Prochlorococcus TaxID=2627481 RepID=UPI000564AC50|nr:MULTISPECIES: hypothetical protein [unclassified Prochlorococcus]
MTISTAKKEPYLETISTKKLNALFNLINHRTLTVQGSYDAYVNISDGRVDLKGFLNEMINLPPQSSDFYVSHPFVFEGNVLNHNIYGAFGGPQTIDLIAQQIRMARLFAGCSGTGTHVHQHTRACFECLMGEKIWFLAPPTKRNHSVLSQYNHELYGTRCQSLNDWFRLELIDNLWPHLEGAKIMRSKAAECLYIPDRYFHATLNQSACIGISYSWRASLVTFDHDALLQNN